MLKVAINKAIELYCVVLPQLPLFFFFLKSEMKLIVKIDFIFLNKFLLKINAVSQTTRQTFQHIRR
jgi:hypothetical protein